MEDAVQEEGRVGRRAGASASTDKYTICLESVFSLIRRILILEDTINEFKAVLKKIHISLSVFVLPSCCIRFVFTHKTSNPLLVAQLLPPPCEACSYCIGGYYDIFFSCESKQTNKNLARYLYGCEYNTRCMHHRQQYIKSNVGLLNRVLCSSLILRVKISLRQCLLRKCYWC